MKLKYIGETFGAVCLTSGKIYDATIENADYYRVIDDSGEDYLYPRMCPRILSDGTESGKWEIIEE